MVVEDDPKLCALLFIPLNLTTRFTLSKLFCDFYSKEYFLFNQVEIKYRGKWRRRLRPTFGCALIDSVHEIRSRF